MNDEDKFITGYNKAIDDVIEQCSNHAGKFACYASLDFFRKALLAMHKENDHVTTTD